jgi:hypothetical protein
VLLALPSGIRELELACPCAGPLPAVLQRFRRLENVDITGNGAGVLWACSAPAAAAVLSKLRSLCLDYRKPPKFYAHAEFSKPALVLQLPAGIAAQLAPATRLTALELRVEWSDGVRVLCGALSALRELK